MTKILGYTDGEIAKLYLLATTIVVIICAALSVLVGTLVMRSVWAVMLQSMSGWFTLLWDLWIISRCLRLFLLAIWLSCSLTLEESERFLLMKH